MALTVAQVREHVGAMMQYGFAHAPFLAKGGLTFREIILWAKEYRLNGTLGTQADRTEAMRTMVRFAFQNVTGMNPDTDAHYFKSHWVDEIASGESAGLGL